MWAAAPPPPPRYSCSALPSSGRRQATRGAISVPHISEDEFRGYLNQARRRRGDDLAERSTGNVAVDGARAVELRVIEDVERLGADLERPGRAQLHLLD